MIFRKTEIKDIKEVAEIYGVARSFMKETNNPSQWANGYPTLEDINSDVKEGCSYVVEEDGQLIAVFYFRIGNDKTYDKIYEGEWINSEPYSVIHRVAVRCAGRGLVGKIFDYCYLQYPNLKIDTHKDNIPMQRALIKNGFARCGIIYLENGDERIAYQKC